VQFLDFFWKVWRAWFWQKKGSGTHWAWLVYYFGEQGSFVIMNISHQEFHRKWDTKGGFYFISFSSKKKANLNAFEKFSSFDGEGESIDNRIGFYVHTNQPSIFFSILLSMQRR